VSDWAPIYELGPGYSSSVFLPTRIIRIFETAIRIERIAEKSTAKVLYAHGWGSLLRSCIAKFLSRGKLKVSWQIYDEEEVASKGFIFTFVSWLLASVRLIDQILVLSMKMKRLAEKNLRVTNVFVLRLGLCPELIELSEKHCCDLIKMPESLRHLVRTQDEHRIRLYFHDILIPRRRLEDLFHAVATLKEAGITNVILYVAGSLDRDRPYVNRLRQLIRELDLSDDVIFLDSLDNDEAIAFWYKYCDFFVFPCDHQSWGLAPLEAMLFGKPVILSLGAGVSEVLAPERLAAIVPPRNPRMLATSIMNLIKDERMRQKLAIRGRDFVRKNLTYISTGRQLEELWGFLPRSR